MTIETSDLLETLRAEIELACAVVSQIDTDTGLRLQGREMNAVWAMLDRWTRILVQIETLETEGQTEEPTV